MFRYTKQDMKADVKWIGYGVAVFFILFALDYATKPFF